MIKIITQIFTLCFFITSWGYTQNRERFINPNTYKASEQSNAQTQVVTNVVIQTNVVTNNSSSNTRSPAEQKVIEFISNTEVRHEQKRENNTNVSITDELDEFMIPSFDPNFTPINAIVLDAGHGGTDPGGVANKIEEKRLVLSLARKLHTLFRKQNRKIKIYVTRKNDTFISLQDRVSKTTRWSANKNTLFISIHANIAYNPRVSGFEIYTLSDRASDSDALATERLENAGFTSDDIQKTAADYSILADLIRDSTRKQSEWLAQYVYKDTLETAKIYGRGLKRANFFVLKYNTVPSILIEVGYMSNAEEAKNLLDEDYQNKLAVGIYKGISRYIQDYNQTKGFTQ